MRRYVTSLAACFTAIAAAGLAACNPQSDSKEAPSSEAYRDLPRDKRVDVLVGGEDALDEEEKHRQRAVRKRLLEQTARGDDAENAINDALDNAERVLSDDDFEKIREDQEKWLKSAKGREINRLVKAGIPVQDAYTSTLQRRAGSIEKLANKLMLSHVTRGLGGFYEDEAGRSVEVYCMPDLTINVVMRIEDATADGGETTLTATGRLDNAAHDKEARLCSTLRQGFCFDIRQNDENSVVVSFDEPDELTQGNDTPNSKLEDILRTAAQGTFYRFAADRESELSDAEY